MFCADPSSRQSKKRTEVTTHGPAACVCRSARLELDIPNPVFWSSRTSHNRTSLNSPTRACISRPDARDSTRYTTPTTANPIKRLIRHPTADEKGSPESACPLIDSTCPSRDSIPVLDPPPSKSTLHLWRRQHGGGRRRAQPRAPR